MARLFHDGFEYDTTTANLGNWDVVQGNHVGTTHARSGTYAQQVTSLSSGSGQGFLKKFVSSPANGPYFFRAYLFIVSLPSANNTIMVFSSTTAFTPTTMCSIVLTSSGTLKLFSGSSTGSAIGSASVAVNDSSYHMLELKTDTTAASGSRVIEARLDGSVFATTSTGTQAASATIGTGGNLGGEAQTTGEWWFDDIALNDSTGSFQTSYPGSGKIVQLYPNGTGDVNTFVTQTGGTAGSSNNYTRVNEVTPDDATSFNGDHTFGHTDMFTMQSSGIGPSDTVNAVAVSVRFRNNIADATNTGKPQIKKISGGTITQGSGFVANTTGWNTNQPSAPRLFNLMTYQDPDGANWTQSTMNTMQAGYIIATGGTNDLDITNVCVVFDYTPAAVTTVRGSTLLSLGVG